MAAPATTACAATPATISYRRFGNDMLSGGKGRDSLSGGRQRQSGR
jgi:hypothetical protein